MDQNDLVEQAKKVLEQNNRHDLYTVPAPELYPHQWLWDSCFIAIGLRHSDAGRAQQEILSILRGQWANGMLPNMVFSKSDKHRRDSNLWRSWQNPFAPDDVATSGITQPPVIAEAVVKVGEMMSTPERRTWYQTVYPALLKYHEWLYAERDPHKEGLVLLIHPWETGLDNTPPWMHELHTHSMPWWVGAVKTLHLEKVANAFRRDLKMIPAEQRLSTVDVLGLYSIQRRLRSKRYDIDKILKHALFSIEDASFNAMFIRANQHLKSIAKVIGKKLPEELIENFKKTEQAYENLWDPYQGQYYSRNFTTHKLIKVDSIATLMPLYAGHITKERAAQLVKILTDTKKFATAYPIPSVPIDSSWYKEFGYWQGPSWINTNWMIIDGLRRYGYTEIADAITEKSLAMVAEHGSYEYFSAKKGTPAGANNFSWTAALAIDLAASKEGSTKRRSSTKNDSKSQK
jgi:hypothetical protein